MKLIARTYRLIIISYFPAPTDFFGSNMDSSSSRSPSFFSALSYLLLMLLVGGPIWWKTTEVYRVSLPYNRIDALSATRYFTVNVQLVTIDTHRDHQLGPKIQAEINAEKSPIFTLSLRGRAPTQEENIAVAKSSTIEELDDHVSRLHDNFMPGTVFLFEVPMRKFDSGGADIMVGRRRCIYFTRDADERRLVEILRETVLGESNARKILDSVRAPNHQRSDESLLTRVTASKKYDILFSLLIPEPEHVLVRWKIGPAIDSFVNPFIESLKGLASFDVKSQVLYLTKLNLKTKAEGARHTVTQSDLGLAINPVENQLASHVSVNPRLNFLVYVPATDEKGPLHIVGDRGDDGVENPNVFVSNSFLIPRWGGVTIYNVPRSNTSEEGSLHDHESAPEIDMKKVMSVFLAQLRELLGVQPTKEKMLLAEKKTIILPIPSPESGLRTWEKDSLFRLRALENLALSRVTLSSLSHLLSQIPNIVINDEIGKQVVDAVRLSEESEKHSDLGRLTQALESSNAALSASEKAFFDPSLLALLYFPEDQKYAIYIPLFLPVLIPVLLSVPAIWAVLRT